MKTGVLLINLGTPDAPNTSAVRRYLREFLMDPLVIQMPVVARWFLVHLLILPFRSSRSAKLYQKIWTDKGSPLLFLSERFHRALSKQLGDAYYVVLGMRYGHPSIKIALEDLQRTQCEKIIIMPLFPQYSQAATGSALAEASRLLKTKFNTVVIKNFFENEQYIESLATLVQENLKSFQPDYILMSYHGIPENHLNLKNCSALGCDRQRPCPNTNRHCYRAQCFETSRLLACALNLSEQSYGVSFQSRLGKTAWISPYTDRCLNQLAEKGIKKLAVVCPSFVTDCLETLEEIGLRAREQWHALGGEDFQLIPALNAHPKWVQTVAQIIYRAEKS